MSAIVQAEPYDTGESGGELARPGRGDLGMISIADRVVTKIAACAAAEHPDAGAAASRMLGRAVPGAGRLGVRGTDLGALPQTTVEVDGAKAFVSLEISVRWPASVPEVTAQVRKHVRERVGELLNLVGLPPEATARFPHEFSGGQRKRVSIARALAVEPEFVVADEPISALDVNIQAQIINLMTGLQERLHLTYLFIAHDLAVVRHISDRIVVLYLGRVVETAPAEELFRRPLHPYTASLISAVPTVGTNAARQRIVLSGEMPSPLNPPSGCPFRTRCPAATSHCAGETPVLSEVAAGHKVACHFPGSVVFA